MVENISFGAAKKLIKNLKEDVAYWLGCVVEINEVINRPAVARIPLGMMTNHLSGWSGGQVQLTKELRLQSTPVGQLQQAVRAR